VRSLAVAVAASAKDPTGILAWVGNQANVSATRSYVVAKDPDTVAAKMNHRLAKIPAIDQSRSLLDHALREFPDHVSVD
jgi:hypothetical protein